MAISMNCKVNCTAEPEKEDYQAERLRLLTAAYNALRSYQYSNQSTELAETVANEIEKHLKVINPD